MDLTDSGIYRDVITAMQGDNKSRYLYAQIVNDGEPVSLANIYPVFRGTKPDGKTIFNPCEKENGYIVAELTAQTLAVPGIGNFEIALYEQVQENQELAEDAQCIATFPFHVHVVESSFDATNMASTDEFQVIERVIANLPLLAHLDDVIHAEEELDEIKEQIRDFILRSDVPANAVFTDTTYVISVDPFDNTRLILTDSNGNTSYVVMNAVNANTVNGHTVESDVPPHAKFTDENTTYTISVDANTSEIVLTDSDSFEQRISVPFAGDAQTVNGHTVNKDVPANAIFTDTTYSPATAQVDGLMTSEEFVKLDGIDEGAEVNQNAFSHVKVGLSTIHASSKMDTVEFVAGNNITLIPNTNDKSVIISSTASAASNVHLDITANWNAQPRLVAEAGHIYVYTDHSQVGGEDIPAIKIGDGNSYLIDMPFADENAKTLLDHINDTDVHTSLAERAYWNNKVTCFLSAADNENLVFSKN